jgi:lysophospholipase L1-like esterase
MPRIQRFLFWLFSLGFLLIGILLAPELSGRMMAEAGYLSDATWNYMRLVSVAAVVTSLLLAITPLLHSTRSQRWLGTLSYASALLLIFELSSAVLLRFTFGFNHIRDCTQYSFHPSLIATPTPGYHANSKYGPRTHNSTGQRNRELDDVWRQSRLRIAAVGGSTTYDIGVGDNDTWVYKFGKLLPPDIQIANFGIQGHSSAEHLTLTNLVLSDYRPDVILYFMGWNDLRSSHTTDLAGDYPYHQRSLYRSLLIDCPFSFTATGSVVKVLLNQLYPNSLLHAVDAKRTTKVSADIDPHALAIYRRNIHLIAEATRAIGAEPIFVPQVPNEAAAVGSAPHWWTPTIPTEAFPSFIRAYNDVLIETAKTEGAIVVPEVLDQPWSSTDFMDFAHFNEAGTTKFAGTLYHVIADHLRDLADHKPAPAASTTIPNDGRS